MILRAVRYTAEIVGTMIVVGLLWWVGGFSNGWPEEFTPWFLQEPQGGSHIGEVDGGPCAWYQSTC